MNKRSVNIRKTNIYLTILLNTAIFVLLIGGCASPPATTGPGKPDATQLQHYEMLQSAIEAKSKIDALAALALLQADVSRWQTDSLSIMKAFVDQAALTDKVAEEDWPNANKMFLDLTILYRNP